MGLDVHMIGGHSLRYSLTELPKHVQLRLVPPYEDPQLETYLKRLLRNEAFKPWAGQVWTFDPLGLASLEEAIATDNCIHFSGPWGLGLRIGKRSFDLSCHMRWNTFLYENDLADRLLSLYRYITLRLGGHQFVVVPDNATASSGFQDRVCEEDSIEDISNALQETFGGPSTRGQFRRALLDDPDFDGFLVYTASN